MKNIEHITAMESMLRENLVSTANNHMHSDSKKYRSFLAMLFAAGDVKRSAIGLIKNKLIACLL